MDFKVKPVGFSGQNSYKILGCQPIKDDSSLYRVNFGNGQSQHANDYGDSFGQRFVVVSKEVSGELKENKKNASPVEIAKKLIGVFYGKN